MAVPLLVKLLQIVLCLPFNNGRVKTTRALTSVLLYDVLWRLDFVQHV